MGERFDGWAAANIWVGLWVPSEDNVLTLMVTWWLGRLVVTEITRREDSKSLPWGPKER